MSVCVCLWIMSNKQTRQMGTRTLPTGGSNKNQTKILRIYFSVEMSPFTTCKHAAYIQVQQINEQKRFSFQI